MTIRAYDLSIISDQEAADRLGVIAAEREDYLDDVVGSTDIPDAAWVMAANRATIALDLLALRKAQVALIAKVDRTVFEENGQWFFWDETQTERYGPFVSRSEAEATLIAYAAQVLDGEQWIGPLATPK
jgi:hypothetical protein